MQASVRDIRNRLTCEACDRSDSRADAEWAVTPRVRLVYRAIPRVGVSVGADAWVGHVEPVGGGEEAELGVVVAGVEVLEFRRGVVALADEALGLGGDGAGDDRAGLAEGLVGRMFAVGAGGVGDELDRGQPGVAREAGSVAGGASRARVTFKTCPSGRRAWPDAWTRETGMNDGGLLDDSLTRALREGASALTGDLAALVGHVLLIEGLLGEKATEVEPSWELAVASAAEIEALLRLRDLIVVRAAGILADDLDGVLAKLAIWRILSDGEEGEIRAEDPRALNLLLLSVEGDLLRQRANAR